MKKIISNIFVLLLIINFSWAQEGSIVGKITDAETKSPLVGVNVVVENTKYGSASNEKGKYRISDIPAGNYNIRFQMMGYEMIKKLNVPVNPGQVARLDIEMVPTSITGDEIIVTGGSFSQPIDATVSSMNLDYTELLDDPGGAMDVQRMMQVLPSVTAGTDKNNEVIVRGGHRGENKVLLDNIEVPNPNHFGMPGTGGGPITMINPLFVEEVDFYAGAFPARFGGKASSVMDIDIREGSRENFHARMDMGMSGIGLNLEGPVNAGQGSYMFGAHKSYMDLLVNSMDMTAVPIYSNGQGKIVYDINSSNKIIWNGIYGRDKINIDEGDEPGGDDENDGVELIDFDSQTYATGITLRSVLNEESYSLLTFSSTGKFWDTDIDKKSIGQKNKLIFTRDNYNKSLGLKWDYFKKFNENNRLRLGFNVKRFNWKTDEWGARDTTFKYGYYKKSDTTRVPLSEINRHNVRNYNYKRNSILYVSNGRSIDKTISTYKPSLFIQYKYNPHPKLELLGGLRYSYFKYSDQAYLSPRLGITYDVDKSTSFNFGYGNHYQEPAYDLFFQNIEQNKDLQSYNSEQYVLGLEHFFTEDMKGSIEIYHKSYDNYPVSERLVQADSINRYSGNMLSVQEGRSRGFELFLQKKEVKNFHFSLSYSHFISEYSDPREGRDGWYTGKFDFRNVVTFISGYQLNTQDLQWYNNLTRLKWWGAVDWLIGLGDEFGASMRFNYNQGRPYTPHEYIPAVRDWKKPLGQELNTKRLKAYHRLDIMIERKWIEKNYAITVYFDLMNIYDRKNVWRYVYSDNGTKKEIYQYNFMPVGGFILEF